MDLVVNRLLSAAMAWLDDSTPSSIGLPEPSVQVIYIAKGKTIFNLVNKLYTDELK
jgi:hypothetical protein